MSRTVVWIVAPYRGTGQAFRRSDGFHYPDGNDRSGRPSAYDSTGLTPVSGAGQAMSESESR